MTRINAGVRAAELPDKLLLAEHREITRIPNAISSGRAVLSDEPIEEFTLNRGHVRFFYHRLRYLHIRYNELLTECRKRGFNVSDKNDSFDVVRRTDFYCYKDWTETPEARRLIIERIEFRGFSLLQENES